MAANVLWEDWEDWEEEAVWLLTHVLWCPHDLSQLLVAAEHSGQTKVHDLDVPEGSHGRQKDVLRLGGDTRTRQIKLEQ